MNFLKFKEQAEGSLYYLCMMSDGEVTKNEAKLFNQICKKMKLNNDEINEIISNCKSLYKEYGNALEVIKNENFAEKLDFLHYDHRMSPIVMSSVAGAKHASGRKSIHDDVWEEVEEASENRYVAPIVWNLINLAYADECFSDDEKKILFYLVKQWKFKKDLFQEMIDTAEAILDLTKELEWFDNNVEIDEEMTKKIKQINNDIKYLHKSVEITIEELSL